MSLDFQTKPIYQNLPSSLFLVLLSMVCFSIPSASSQEPLTAYDILQQYNFPVGLLPKGVIAYEIDRSTGEFTLHLKETCTFTIDSYDLKYKTTVTGVLSKDKISNLKGIQVKVLILWLNIATVTRDGDELDLSVGIASADFPVDSFYVSPTCGCGFDCVTEENNRIQKNGLVSSS